MTDITKIVPQESPVVTAIYDWHKKRNDAEPKRGYLGASIIGHECDRYLWYNFRQCCSEEFDGRKLRLFQTGHFAEPRFVEELRGIGCEIHEANADGSQFGVEAIGGHFSGHMDGAGLGIPGAPKTWHVLEMKTHSNKNFATLVKKCVEKGFPSHYAQTQAYMGLTKMKRALYLAVNKDTDALYAERIRFDKKFFDAMMARAERIITSKAPPERAFSRRDYFKCNWCEAQDLCWGSEKALPIPSVSCRQCCHTTPTMDGDATWKCELYGRGLSPTDQDAACKNHLILPGLISFAEPVDHGMSDGVGQWIDFATTEGGEIWRHGCGAGEYTTEELRLLPKDQVNTKSFTGHAKATLGAKVDAVAPDNIIDRYPKEDVETVWEGAICDIEKGFQDTFAVNPWEPEAIFQCVDFEAAEFEHGEAGAVVIKWLKTGTGEIRIGKE